MKAPDSFVPLTGSPAPSAPREFRVTILNGHTHAEPSANGSTPEKAAPKNAGFQALETQRPASLNANGGTEKKIGEPRISIQRDGDRVTHLRIQCSCGQILDLACVYDGK